MSLLIVGPRAVDADRRVAPQASTTATVTFVGAVIGARSDGHKWDGGDVFSSDDLRRLRDASAQLATNGVAGLDPWRVAEGVAGMLAAATLSYTDKPDAIGTVQLVIDGNAGAPVALDEVKHTYTPSWTAGSMGGRRVAPTWPGVRLDRDVRLRVRLEDYDPLAANDPIGSVEINSDDLLRAAQTRRVVPIFVGNQSSNQLMFVYVSVTLDNKGY